MNHRSLEKGNVYYHVWFSPKRRKWLLQGDIDDSIRGLLQETAKEKGRKLLELESVIDHVHLVLELPPNESLSRAIKLLKGVTARRVFQKLPQVKLDAGTNHFWQRRYGSKMIPEGAVDNVRAYVRTQRDRLEKFER